MTHFRAPSADHARELVIEVKTTFRGPLAEKIESEAERLGVTPVDRGPSSLRCPSPRSTGASMNRTDAALIAIAAQKECAAGRWIDIESAPKDGTRILIGRRGFWPQMASWRRDLTNFDWPWLTPIEPGEMAMLPTHFAFVAQPPEVPE